MTAFTEVTTEVLHIADGLIAEHHPALRHARVGFVFRDTAALSAGKTTLAQASKINPKLQVHLDLDFLIWIAEDFWTTASFAVRTALLDHELCHCDWNNGQPRIRPHDIEEFVDVIDRRGFWSRDLFNAAGAFRTAMQLDLPDLVPARPGGVVQVKIGSFGSGWIDGSEPEPETEPA